MAKLERTFYHNDFDRLLEKIEEGIINGSAVSYTHLRAGAASVSLSATAGQAVTG